MLVFIYGVYSSSAMGIEGLNSPFYIVGLPLFGLFTFVFHKLCKYLYFIYFWDEYDYVLVLYQISIMIILSFATSVVWTVARVLDDSDSQGCGAVEIDISQAPENPTSNSNGGKYGSGGITIQVEKKEVKKTGGGASTWVGYKHFKSGGGTFKLLKITHSDKLMRSSSGTPPLTDNMSQTFPHVTAIYVYYEGTDIDRPKVICISEGDPSDTSKNTWYKAVSSPTDWSEDKTTFAGKDPCATQGTSQVTEEALKNAAANSSLTVTGDNIIIKLDKRPDGVGAANQIKYRTKNNVIVEGLTPNSGFKGYKHDLGAKETIDKVKIHGNDTGITGTALQDKRYIFVYYASSDENLQKPYLICLSKEGRASPTTGDNIWYKRTGTYPNYTWTDDSGSYNNKDPNTISGLAGNLTTIKNALDASNDTGYPIPVDRTDDLPNEVGTENSVKIRIDKTALGYNNDDTGNEITNPSDITAGKIKVFLKNNEPKFGFKRYMHKVKGTGVNEYKKMSSVTYKNGGNTITGITATSNVHYVYVYYGGNDRNTPLLIAVCTRPSSGTDIWKYYKNDQPTNENNTNWSEETINGDPNNTNNAFLMQLDKLNDQALQKDVIHIEKTEIKGVNSIRQYYTGYQGTTPITVEKSDDAQKVPSGYVRYKHQGTINNPIIKHNGIELTFDPNPPTAQAVYVYYEKDNDSDHQFPLIVCVDTGSNPWKYYKRGNTWKEESELRSINPENPSSTRDGLDTLQQKLNDVKGKFEVKLDKSASYGFNSQIDVSKDTGGTAVTGYTYYRHSRSTAFKIEKVRYNGNVVGGFPLPIENITEVNVYYSNTDLNKPLLMYTRLTTTPNHKYYGRGMKWWEITKLSGQAPNAADLQPHLEMLLNRQGTFKELICFDNGDHWSPILMLSFSLGTIYAFYPTISPYSLIDPERAEKIDLWIAVTCAMPNLALAILDLDNVDMGPGGNGPDNNWRDRWW